MTDPKVLELIAAAKSVMQSDGKDLARYARLRHAIASVESSEDKPIASGVQIRNVNWKDAVTGLDEIFGELQVDFHDRWDWMRASFFLEVLKCEIESSEDWISKVHNEVRLAEHKIDQYLQGQGPGTVRLGVALQACRNALLLLPTPPSTEPAKEKQT